MQTKTVGPRRVSFLAFFEDRYNSRFPMAKSFGNKLRRQRRFSRPRRPRHEETVAFEKAPAHHLVQIGNARGKPPTPRRFLLFADKSQRAREGLQPAIGNADGVQSRHRVLPAHFHDLQFSHHGISLHILRKPEETIGDGEQRIVPDLRRVIFANQKRRGFPTSKKLGEALDERLQLYFARAARRCAHHGAKGIYHHDTRIDRRDLFGNFIVNRVQILIQHHVSQVDKADGLAQLGFVEERILLLVAQHFYGGFAEDGEKERGFFRRGIGENDLMHHRGFAATGRAGDDVERKFWDTAAQDVVEAAHAARYFADRGFTRLAHEYLLQFAFSRIILLFHFYILYQNPNC